MPGPDELLVRVRACGVCRHRPAPRRGRPGAPPPARRARARGGRRGGRGRRTTFPGGRSASGSASPGCATPAGACRSAGAGPRTSARSRAYTGWDADGGYAEYAVVPPAYAYRLPEPGTPTSELAPLLCAGIIGYRALRRAELPPGGRLGIYGFGASAHLTAQVALAQGARVHVLTRSPRRAAARPASSAPRRPVTRTTPPPEPLDAAILFAPVGDLVPVALAALDRGGTLAVAGIHLTDIPALNYERHLFQERTLRSVTANTRQDGRDFLAFAGGHPAARAHDAVPARPRRRRAGRPGRRPGHRRRRARHAVMLWLARKRLSGSYWRLTSTSRSHTGLG